MEQYEGGLHPAVENNRLTMMMTRAAKSEDKVPVFVTLDLNSVQPMKFWNSTAL